MERIRRAQETERFIAELRGGSTLTGPRVASAGGSAYERSVWGGSRSAVSAAAAGTLQNPTTGRRVFMVGLDSIGALEAGLVELG